MVPADTTARDVEYLDIALRLARRGLGTTAPNPSVGAVIVDAASGEIIARGRTQPGGRPHAETEALRRAGDRARGTTLYVSLEPCSHHGRTPPCADAIITAGVRRVVAAIADPDPRVSGRGLERLRQAGIEVTTGLLSDNAKWVARGHIVRLTERRPFIQLKLAVDADGQVRSGSAGRPVWVTGPEARAHGHLLRAHTDAILVGRQTVIDDDPELTCRLPGLEGRSPVRIVLAKTADGLLGSKLLQSARTTPVWVFSAKLLERGRGHELERCGARVFPVPVVADRLWLPAVAEAIVAEGLTRLLVEGGPTSWRAFAAAGLADEAVLFHARPGSDPVAIEQASGAVTRLMGDAGLRLADQRRLPADDMFVFSKRPLVF